MQSVWPFLFSAVKVVKTAERGVSNNLKREMNVPSADDVSKERTPVCPMHNSKNKKTQKSSAEPPCYMYLGRPGYVGGGGGGA